MNRRGFLKSLMVAVGAATFPKVALVSDAEVPEIAQKELDLMVLRGVWATGEGEVSVLSDGHCLARMRVSDGDWWLECGDDVGDNFTFEATGKGVMSAVFRTRDGSFITRRIEFT